MCISFFFCTFAAQKVCALHFCETHDRKNMKKVILSVLGIVTVILAVCLVGCVKEEPNVYGSISGFVKDSDTKKSLAGVNVKIQQSGVSQMTGDNGAFTFTDLEPATYTLVFTRDSYEEYEQNVVVKAGAEATVQIALDPIVPELQLSTNALDFGKEINTMSFDISNKGKGELTWSLSYDLPWLVCSPREGRITQKKQTVSLTVDRTKLERGAYIGSVVVESNGGSQTVLVSVSVIGSNLEVEPNELDFGSLTNSIQMTLKNVSKKGTLKYKVESANKWLTLERTAGEITDTDYLNAFVSRDGLSAGNYTSSILFTVDSGTVSVPVKMAVAVNEKPTITLEEATEIKYNSAILHGTVVSPGSAAITRYGFCWVEGEGNPTVDNFFTNLGDCTKPMAFESFITNLKSETMYSYRAYAENSVGLTYSERVRTFVTPQLPSMPTVITGYVLEVGSSTASVNGQIGSLGNVDKISHYGHVMATTDEPTIDKDKFSDLGETTQIGTFTSFFEGLDANTVYYYRAYATNDRGTAYGETMTLTTYKGNAVVKTTEPTGIIHNAATVGGEITDTGGHGIVEKGVCWGTSPQPNKEGNHMVATDGEKSKPAVQSQNNKNKPIGTGTLLTRDKAMPNSSMLQPNRQQQPIRKAINGGTFSCRIEGLEKQTSYYVRAYIITDDGLVYYGSDQRFTTSAEVTLPTLSEVSVTDIKPTTAQLTATVVSNGNAEIMNCGFCYGTVELPTVDNNYVECDPNSKALGKKLTDLDENTTYYVRAFAVNNMGINYSPTATKFKTGAITRPQLSSVIVDNIGKTTATVSSSIVSDGNSPITECGMVWSTTANPTLTDNSGKYQLSKENFTVKLTGLPELSTIHVRAYAINAIGTAYSDDMPFQTTNIDNDVWDGTIATKFGGGMGTAGNPILVTAADQLALLAKNVNNGTTYNGVYFQLTTNISLNNRSWTSIGSGSSTFAGNFDGNGMVISGLNNTSGYGGLFGNNSGTIQNVNVSGSSSGTTNTAGIAASNSGMIANCVSSVAVNGNGVSGGIVAYSTGTIQGCRNQGTVTSTGEYVGGICGKSVAGTFRGNKNTASVNGSDYVGGICGGYDLTSSDNESHGFENCNNSGTLSGTAISNGIGGIVGHININNTNHLVGSGNNGKNYNTVTVYIYNSYNRGDIDITKLNVSGGICGSCSLFGMQCPTCYYAYQHLSSLYIVNCVNNSNSNNLGILGSYDAQTSQSGETRSYSVKYNNSYWLYDLVNNFGHETGVGTDNYIDAWYMHDNAGCYLKNSHDDIVTLLNNWVNTNGPTDYKKWKYESIDGFAVPVFDE